MWGFFFFYLTHVIYSRRLESEYLKYLENIWKRLWHGFYACLCVYLYDWLKNRVKRWHCIEPRTVAFPRKRRWIENARWKRATTWMLFLQGRAVVWQSISERFTRCAVLNKSNYDHDRWFHLKLYFT